MMGKMEANVRSLSQSASAARRHPSPAAIIIALFLFSLAVGCRETQVNITTSFTTPDSATRLVEVSATDDGKTADLPDNLALLPAGDGVTVVRDDEAAVVDRQINGRVTGEVSFRSKHNESRELWHDVEVVRRDYTVLQAYHYSESFYYYLTARELVRALAAVPDVVPPLVGQLAQTRFGSRTDTSRLVLWAKETLAPALEEAAVAFLFSAASDTAEVRYTGKRSIDQNDRYMQIESELIYDLLRSRLGIGTISGDAVDGQMMSQFIPDLLHQTLRGPDGQPLRISADDVAFFMTLENWQKAVTSVLPNATGMSVNDVITPILPIDYIVAQESVRFTVTAQLPGTVSVTNGAVEANSEATGQQSNVRWEFSANDLFPHMSMRLVATTILPDAEALALLSGDPALRSDPQKLLESAKRILDVIEEASSEQRQDQIAILRESVAKKTAYPLVKSTLPHVQALAAVLVPAGAPPPATPVSEPEVKQPTPTAGAQESETVEKQPPPEAEKRRPPTDSAAGPEWNPPVSPAESTSESAAHPDQPQKPAAAASKPETKSDDTGSAKPNSAAGNNLEAAPQL